MARKSKNNTKKILYLNSGYYTSVLKDELLNFNDYTCICENIDYTNFYKAKYKIFESVLENDTNIIISEGVGAYCSLFVSNEILPDDYNIVSRIFINPILKPSEDLEEHGFDENTVNTYISLEDHAYKQHYLDTRHSFCIFSKDNKLCETRFEEFKNKTHIHSIIVDEINENFIKNELLQYIDRLASVKEINIK